MLNPWKVCPRSNIDPPIKIIFSGFFSSSKSKGTSEFTTIVLKPASRNTFAIRSWTSIWVSMLIITWPFADAARSKISPRGLPFRSCSKARRLNHSRLICFFPQPLYPFPGLIILIDPGSKVLFEIAAAKLVAESSTISSTTFSIS